eukprot:scaffold21.g2121.t1
MSSKPGLTYRRSSTGGERLPPVDWEAVDEELARVNPDFTDPRFDSLKHVLNVLSSSNAEAELEELREQRASIEQLVDTVVEGYHSGFNKSLHNYSQILRLFTESKLQLESLRRSLEAAKRRLGAQSRHMQAQWRRDLMLTDTLRLLGDIRSVSEVPAAVARLEEGQEWPAAVAQLLDGCNKLARAELAGVGALRELREEMGRRRVALQAGLLAEVEARLYDLDSAAAGAQRGGVGEGAVARPGAEAGVVPRLALGAARRSTSGSGDGDGASPGGSLSVRMGGGAALLRTASAGRADPSAGLLPSGRPSHRRAASSLPVLGPAPAAGLAAPEGHLVRTELPLSALVDCIAQLGGVQEMQATLRQRMPRQLAAVVSRAVELFPAERWLPPQDSEQLPPTQRGAGGTQCHPTIPPEVVAAAQGLMEHVLGCCLQVFQNVARLLGMLAMARVPKASSGLELLLALRQRQAAEAQGPGGGGSPSAVATGPPGVETARAECQSAWEAMQLECQRLLANLLNVHAPAHQALGQEGDLPGAGWLASASELELSGDAGSPGEPSTLTFALEHEVGDLLSHTPAQQDGGAPGTGAGDEAAERRARVRRALGGHPGGPALMAGLYRLVLQFAESGERVIASLGTPIGASAGAEAAGSCMAALLVMPWRAGSEAGAPEHSLLRSYVESFLRMEFLPAVYVNSRARCTAALEDSEAFKPRTRLRAPYQPTVAEGRPVLPAALAAEAMVQELLGWAAQVPPFATHLTGVVENVLGKVLDAFQAQLEAAVGGSTAGRLAGDLQLVQLMVKEPAAALLGSPVAFFMGRNADAMESFVSSVIAAGFGANDEAVEAELLRRLLAERPIQAGALLSANGDSQRPLALAALSDSLDYLADVILQATAAAGGPGSVDGGSAGATPRMPPPDSGASSPGHDGLPPRTDSWQQPQPAGRRLRGWRQRGGRLEAGLTEGLAHLADRCRALAGHCVRALRIDLLLLMLFHLQELPRSSYVCSEEEAGEVDECIGALSRAVGRLDADLAPHLPPHKRAYAFGSLATAAPRTVVWLLPELRAVNGAGVTRMQRMLASLQPALAGAGGPAAAAGAPAAAGGAARAVSARAFDRAKQYYQLLTYSAEGVVQTAVDKPARWSGAEYLALLAVEVPGRGATPEHRAALERALVEAGRLQRPSKPAAALQGLQQGAAATLQGLREGVAKLSKPLLEAAKQQGHSQHGQQGQR